MPWRSAWVGEHHTRDARVATAVSTGSVICAPSGKGRLGDGRIGGDQKLGWTFDG